MDKSYASMREVERITQGQVMPSRYYKAEHVEGIDNDGLYIHTQLSRVNIKQRERGAKFYQELYTGEKSRQECNRRLREYADKCEDLAAGKVFSPGACNIGEH